MAGKGIKNLCERCGAIGSEFMCMKIVAKIMNGRIVRRMEFDEGRGRETEGMDLLGWRRRVTKLATSVLEISLASPHSHQELERKVV